MLLSMKNSLLKDIRTLVLIISIIAALGGCYYFGLEMYFIAFGVGILTVSLQTFNQIKFRNRIENNRFIKIKSTQWVYQLLNSFLTIIPFSTIDNSMNFWNVSGVSLILFAGVFTSIRYRYDYYKLTEKGVWSLLTDTLIVDTKKITQLKVDKNELVINTTKYRNDLSINSSKIVSPTWYELSKELEQISKKWKSDTKFIFETIK